MAAPFRRRRKRGRRVMPSPARCPTASGHARCEWRPTRCSCSRPSRGRFGARGCSLMRDSSMGAAGGDAASEDLAAPMVLRGAMALSVGNGFQWEVSG
jgi:hypothetical protein